jgi:formate-dependent nitrite reductase membrane component NrfD
MKNRLAYRLLGLYRIIIWSAIMIFGFLLLPMALYYDSRPDAIPTILMDFYENPSSLWRWSVMLISAFFFISINGFIFLFFGWKLMHPIRDHQIDIKARRELILQKGKEIKQQVLQEILTDTHTNSKNGKKTKNQEK